MSCLAWVSWSMKRSGRVIGRNLQPAVEQAGPGEVVHHRGAKTARRRLLDGDEHRVMPRQLLDQPTSSGLAKRASATVADSPRAASSSAARNASPNRVPSDRIATVLPSRRMRPRPSASTSPRMLRQGDAGALAARVAQRARPVVDHRRGRHHVHQLGLVGRRHQHHPRQAAEIGEVEAAGVGRAVGADQPGAVHREAHRQALDRHVVHHLVVGALQEGRVDGAERPQPLGRHAGGEGHRVLLGDADVEAALGEALGEAVETGARRHRRGDRDDHRVALRLADQRVGEHRLIGRRLRRLAAAPLPSLTAFGSGTTTLKRGETLCSLSAAASAGA